jgi:hypothetical protein
MISQATDLQDAQDLTISMISLSDFFTVPPVRHARAWSDTSSVAPEGPSI